MAAPCDIAIALSCTETFKSRGVTVALVGTLMVNAPLPRPPAGELTVIPVSRVTTDQEQLSAAAILKDAVPPRAENAGASPDRLYWQGSPDPGSTVFQTPRPCVKA